MPDLAHRVRGWVSEWASEYVSQVEPANTIMKRWVHTHAVASSEMIHLNILLGFFFPAASRSPGAIIVLSLRFRKSLGGKYQSLLHQVMCCCDWDTWHSQLLPDPDTVSIITAQSDVLLWLRHTTLTVTSWSGYRVLFPFHSWWNFVLSYKPFDGMILA